jgi:hypothetical protein
MNAIAVRRGVTRRRMSPVRSSGKPDNTEERYMESNDYWTHVGLATAFFVAVVGPRLFSPGHTVNSLTYIVGAAVVVIVATVARRGPKVMRRRMAGERP